MDNVYAASYRHLYETHWWWRAREAQVLELVRSLCPEPGQARILDVGCGDALLFDKLATLGEVEGVEVSADLVADDNPWRDQVYIGPFDTEYQPDRQFDLILMLDVLEHFADPVAALRHAHSLLAPDGHLIIHVPAFPQLWTAHDDFNHHYIRYTRQTLNAVLQNAHFDAASMHYTFHWTYAAKRLVRWKERLVSARPKPASVPAAWINHSCYWLCRLEQCLFRTRKPEFGSSLLAVASPVSVPAHCDTTLQGTVAGA